jgi:DNA-binding PadR family transcriptional regulator
MATSPSAADELTQTGRVVLGMLAEGHSTGYAIKAEIERSTRQFWSASVGGIYPELKRLSGAGLISVRDDPRGETRRHCYSLTDAGRAALNAWLTDAAEPTFEMRNEPLLRLRFAGVLGADDRAAVVRRMVELYERRVAQLQAVLAADDFDDEYDRMSHEFLLGLSRWARDWAAELPQRLAAAG